MMEWIAGILAGLLALISVAASFYRKGKSAGSQGEALDRAVREWKGRSEAQATIAAAGQEASNVEAKARADAEAKHRELELEQRRIESGSETMDIRAFDARLAKVDDDLKKGGDP